MKASAESLAAVFGRADRFIIPEYQRAYSWEEEEIAQLWSDLKGAFDEDCSLEPGEAGDDYFLGPMVITTNRDKAGNSQAHVVDGQQRLTTLNTLLWIVAGTLRTSAGEEDQDLAEVLRGHLMRGKVTRFQPAKKDQANYRAIVEGAPVDSAPKLGRAAEYLRARVAELDGNRPYLVALTRFILGRTRVVLVETESFVAAWDLFIGLNGKGKPLTPGDLIKAFVCGQSADSEQMSAVWEERVLPLQTDTTAALLDIVRVGTGRVGSEQQLFRQFELAWKEGQLGDILLGNAALAYAQLWRTPLEEVTGLGQGNRALRGARALDRRDHGSVLLALASKHGFEFAVRAELLRLVEAYQLWMAVRGKHGRERAFTQLANAIWKGTVAPKEAVVRFASVMKEHIPPVEEVRRGVEAAAYPSRVMKFIVREYEEGLKATRHIGDIQFEHIMPKTATEFWFRAAGTLEPLEYARIVNNIGNIVPLDQATNIVGQNDPWETKRRLYISSVPQWGASMLAHENPDAWTPQQIRARAAKIATWAVEDRWNFPALAADLERWIGSL